MNVAEGGIAQPSGTLRRHQALAVATAFLALFSIVGVALYGLPFFYDFFFRDLGWTRQAVTSGNAYSKIGAAVIFGLIAGVIVDAFGPRRLMLVGIVLAGGALVGLSTVTSSAFWLFYFFYGLNALGYVFGGPLPNQVMLSRYFDAGRGRAMGIAYLGIGIGGVIVLQLAPSLIQAIGWRGALRALGILIIVVALPAAFFVREPHVAEGGRGEPPRLDGAGRATGPVLQRVVDSLREIPAFLRGMLKRPAFYLLALGSMASIGAVGGTMQNLKFYLSIDRGLTQAEAGNVGSIILFGSIGGRLLMGWLADRWAKKHVMLLIYVIVAASIPLMAIAPTGAILHGAALLFGIGLGGDYMMIPLMAAELFGLRILGRLMGVVLTADGIAEAVVPMGVAALRDATGSYATGFGLLVALACLGAVAVALLPRSGPRTAA
jgi:sugar phosphate permease